VKSLPKDWYNECGSDKDNIHKYNNCNFFWLTCEISSTQDWYNESDSAWFSKASVRLEGRGGLVVVEATELGDVLVLAGAPFKQGVETPAESSTTTLESCGQAFTFPFYLQVNAHEVMTLSLLILLAYIKDIMIMHKPRAPKPKA
jgi:hypothetical protein